MNSLPTLLSVRHPGAPLRGEILLDGSKSISNRALLLLTLAKVNPVNWLTQLSTSTDTRSLREMLLHDGDIFQAGEGGTTFRFMAAFMALRPEQQILTAGPRMRERPVEPLVRALRDLGAQVEYLEKEGFPPLGIRGLDALGQGRRTIHIAADVSSQFLSALLMIAPYLPDGLELIPKGQLVSRPYLEMTLRMMRYFGVQADWQEDAIVVEAGTYQPLPLRIEADWSAASYWYALAALSKDVDLRLRGLFAESWQGDAVLPQMMQRLGIATTFEADGIRLQRTGAPLPAQFEWDFVECPDLAQTLAVVCAGLGVRGIFSGLETLAVKETDRIKALQIELAKVGVSLARLPMRFSSRQPEKTFYLLEGQAAWTAPPHFATYGDHRMAMALAPLGLLAPVVIENHLVVKKSYPQFWQHLHDVGFELSTLP